MSPRSELIQLQDTARAEALVYTTERVHYAVDRDAFLRFLQQRRSELAAGTTAPGAEFRPAELRDLDYLELRALADTERRVADEIAHRGHYRLDHRQPLLTKLLEAGLGTLRDRRTGEGVPTVTMRPVNTHSGGHGPFSCGTLGREFLLPDGAVFLSVIDAIHTSGRAV